jgi:hypothetical protein
MVDKISTTPSNYQKLWVDVPAPPNSDGQLDSHCNQAIQTLRSIIVNPDYVGVFNNFELPVRIQNIVRYAINRLGWVRFIGLGL